MKIKSAAGPLFSILLALSLIAAAGTPGRAADQPKKHKAHAATHSKPAPALPALHSSGHRPGKSGEGRREVHQGRLPRSPGSNVPVIVNSVMGILNSLPSATPVARPLASPPPGGLYWYWCDASRQYYPYAASCPSGWRAVPPR
jgi:hypothetical protein